MVIIRQLGWITFQCKWWRTFTCKLTVLQLVGSMATSNTDVYTTNKIMYNSYSSIFFFYYSISGLLTGFLSVFLESKGFSSLEMGEIMGLFITSKIIGPMLLAKSTDITGDPLAKIRLASLFAIISFSFLLWVNSYWLIIISLVMFGLFWTSILPLLSVMTLNSFNDDARRYSRIRLWGSFGFIILAVIAGIALGELPPNIFAYLGVSSLLLLYLSTLILKKTKSNMNTEHVNVCISEKIFTRSFISFFIASLMLTISFGPYSAFFALYLRDLGYPSYSVGLFISLGVIAEIIMFIYVGTFLHKFKLGSLIIFCISITGVRWFLLREFADNLTLLVLSQLLHAVSFALYHTASMQYLQNHFEPKQQNRGQAVYSAGVYGIGGALGAYLAGLLWANGIGYKAAYDMAIIMTIIGSISAAFMLKDEKKHQQNI